MKMGTAEAIWWFAIPWRWKALLMRVMIVKYCRDHFFRNNSATERESILMICLCAEAEIPLPQQGRYAGVLLSLTFPLDFVSQM